MGKVGRPKKENSKNREYRIRLTEDEYLSLKRMSEKTHLTMAGVIRNGLKIYKSMIGD